MVKLRSGLCNPVFTVRWKKISYDNKNKNGTESEKSRFPDVNSLNNSISSGVHDSNGMTCL